VTAPTRLPAASDPGQCRRPRCLHLIDLESLAGGLSASASTRDAIGDRGAMARASLRLAWASYRRAIGIQRGDHAFLGLRAALFGEFGDLFVSGGAQLRVGAGPGRVRSALLQAVDVPHDAQRFDWLVIAAAHEQFAGLADEAREAGMRVWLVGGSASFTAVLATAQAERSHLQFLGTAA
jgi:hypothetical protein